MPAELNTDGRGKSWSFPTLHYKAIILRALNARDLELLALVPNARTSVEVIDRFYAEPLTGAMCVDLLHSQRRPPNVPAPKVNTEGQEVAKKVSKKDKIPVRQV